MIHAAGDSQASCTLRTDRERTISHDVDQWIDKTLGNYRIDEFLGAGGMGAVYRARHLHLRCDVAIKFVLTGRGDQRKAMQRFLREWKASAKVDDPHVVRAMDAGEIDGTAYLALEFVNGSDLRVLQSRLRELPNCSGMRDSPPSSRWLVRHPPARIGSSRHQAVEPHLVGIRHCQNPGLGTGRIYRPSNCLR